MGGAQVRQDAGLVPGALGARLAAWCSRSSAASRADRHRRARPPARRSSRSAGCSSCARYLALAMVQTYFLAGLVAGRRPAPARAATPRCAAALDIANSRLHRLLPWAIVTATVTMILQAIEERFGHRRHASSPGLVGLAWNLVTFLVVPILVLEDLGVGDALKRSKDLFKQTWGENVIGQFGLGMVGFLAMLPGPRPDRHRRRDRHRRPDRARCPRRGVADRVGGGGRGAERHLPHRAVPLRRERRGARRVLRHRLPRRVPAASRTAADSAAAAR